MNGIDSNDDAPQEGNEAIAIVGIAVRLPEADTPEQFWNNLCSGRETITSLSDAQLRAGGVAEHQLTNPRYIRAAGRLDAIDQFDAGFFAFNARQAALTDPQQRLMLECAWEALEDAGCDPRAGNDAIGVFVGARISTYERMLRTVPVQDGIEAFERQFGVDHNFLATRVSHKLNLKGPSLTIATGCSTSLVATHVACQSLLGYECDAALVGAACVQVPQQAGYLYHEGSILSSDGSCRAFDVRASGTVPGSGVVMVLLMRQSDALAQGYHMYALIRGTAINNDGADKVGYTAPSVGGQAHAIATAQAIAMCPPQSIQLIETHGTATVLGDSVELEALHEVFKGRTAPRSCALGALKTNIGHLDAAAGIAGLVKAALCLEHRAFVPSLYHQEPLPDLKAADSPFYVNTTYKPWPTRNGMPRRAAVSSFGIGGTNAHAILEEAPQEQAISSLDSRPVLVPLSARTTQALQAMTTRLTGYLRKHPTVSCTDVAYTLQVGRRRFGHRRCVVAENMAELLRLLGSPESGETQSSAMPEDRAVTLAFAGLPIERGVVAALYEQDEVFRRELDDCARTIARLSGVDVRAWLCRTRDRAEGVSTSPSHGQHADHTITALASFAVGYGVARRLMAHGVKVETLAAQGVGEYSAACAVGILSIEQAVRFLSLRLGVALANEGGQVAEFVATVTSPRPRYVSAQAIGSVSHSELARVEYWMSRDITRALPVHEWDTRALGLGDSVLVEVSSCAPTHSGAKTSTPQTNVVNALGNGRACDARTILQTIGELWRLGVAIDWQAFNAGAGAKRLSLPTYPFERSSYWMEPGVRAAPTAPAAAAGDSRLALEDWFIVPTWVASLPPQAASDSELRAQTAAWVVLQDDSELCAAVLRRLRRAGANVVTVATGKTYARLDHNKYTIDPYERDSYRELFRGVQQEHRSIAAIIAWHDGAEIRAGDGDTPISACSGALRTLALAQALGESAAQPHRVVLAGRELLRVTGSEHSTGGAAIPLVAIIASQECPQLRCRVVDVPNCARDSESQRIDLYANWLLAEAVGDAGEYVAAYRHGRRLVREYRRVVLDTNRSGMQRLRRGGIYAITGGMGKLGSRLAAYLAREYQAKLLLIGKRTDRACVDAISAAGGQAICVAADVASATQLRAAIVEGERAFGPIEGVFHLAADTRDASIGKHVNTLTPEDIAAQMRPKLGGLQALTSVFAERSLGFGLVFSSNAAILGGMGRTAYAIANGLVDAYVHELNRDPNCVWMSVNWDGWLTGAEMQANGDSSLIAFADGMQALTRILSHCTVPQLVVSATNLDRRVATWLRLSRAPAANATPLRTAIAPAVTARAPGTEIEQALAKIWREILAVADVGVDDDFFDLGGDSLLALRVLVRARDLYRIELPVSCMFDTPTIAELSAEVARRLARRAEDAGAAQATASDAR